MIVRVDEGGDRDSLRGSHARTIAASAKIYSTLGNASRPMIGACRRSSLGSTRHLQGIEDQRKLGKILLEGGEVEGEAGRPLRRSADGHNRERIRGIPIVGRAGGGGASPRHRSSGCPPSQGGAGRTLAVALRRGLAVDVVCGDCGGTFELSVRLGVPVPSRRSGAALRGLPASESSDERGRAREDYVAWWLYASGLSVDELLEIAAGLGPAAT